MSGLIHRRALITAVSALAASPQWARADQDGLDVIAYYDRLRRRLDDAGGGRFIPAAEDALAPEHNMFRARQGLGALVRHPALDAAARAHAADMIEREFFAHDSPEGLSSVERVGLLARRFVGLAGENIVEVRGGPPSSAAELANLWRDSPGHRANMLRGAYSHVGFGVARRGERTVAAAVFGERYAELATAMAFRIGGAEAIGQSLAGSDAVRGYALHRLGGGGALGPFWFGDPAPENGLFGAFSVKPYLADPATPRRFLIVDGPIVQFG